MKVFYEGIDQDGSEDLSLEETERFVRLLELSSIVSMNDLSSDRDYEDWGMQDAAAYGFVSYPVNKFTYKFETQLTSERLSIQK